MKRDLSEFERTEFDLLIIGGGIYGAIAAWDAALRGLRVGLVEKNDFASGTSFNSLKIIHGGLRYLQHADLKRMRESITERRLLSYIAPHQIHPLPCMMPTYGHAIKGPEAMRIALFLNDLVGYDRNKLKDPEKHLPSGRVTSKDELLNTLPFIDDENITGGAVWYDAKMTNSERLVLLFLRSAEQLGATVANYVNADELLLQNNKVIGVKAVDTLTNTEFKIKSKLVLNTTGPWMEQIFKNTHALSYKPKVQFSTAINLVLNRTLTTTYAFGVSSKNVFSDDDAIIKKGSRLLFAVPWQQFTLVGTEHKPYDGTADSFTLNQHDIQLFLEQVKNALPRISVKEDDIGFVYSGLLPMSGINEETGDVRLEKHFDIIDHRTDIGLDGIFSILSVKYTTARGVVEIALDKICQYLGKKLNGHPSRKHRIWGGDIDSFTDFIKSVRTEQSKKFDQDIIDHLVHAYGSEYGQVIRLVDEKASYGERIVPGKPFIKAQVVHAIRHEMVGKLSDIILRRTGLGAGGYPGKNAIDICAEIAGEHLNWSRMRINSEIKDVYNYYDKKLAKRFSTLQPLKKEELDV